jgi:Na+-transporting NADH:ubiquinone oxidoreductase subunit F
VCADIQELTYDIKQFRFELKVPDRMKFVPGHYVQFLSPVYEGSEEEVYRAYSISSDPSDEGFIELIVRLVPNGICTTYMFKHLRVGDPVRINGPYGDFRLSDTDAPVVFVAGGSGMEPIKSMIH